jgi:hypothetical protein
MNPSIYDKIEHDRLEKWRRFRERNGMAADAPFSGKHPLLEAYEEALDAINYLGEAKRRMEGLPAASVPWEIIWRAKLLATKLALYCLGAIEALRERGAWEEETE